MISNNCYFCVVILVISLIYCSEGQLNNSQLTRKVPNFPRVPLCYFGDSNDTAKLEDTYEYSYFDSNETHINNESYKIYINFYNSTPTCPMYNEKMVTGFIYNGSIIAYYSLVNISDYCIIEDDDGTLIFEVCDNSPVTKGQLYFPCLIVSTICYFVSALVYKFLLQVKDVYKKCFVGYSISMGVTFFCLILLQKVNTSCNEIGSIFFVFIISSFVWLLCLCLDLLYMVRYFREGEEKPERLYLYIAGSILFPVVILVSSIVPTGIPDVPSSFMRGFDLCEFKETRITILFVPIAILLALTILSIGTTFYFISKNGKDYKNDILWLEQKSQCRYRTISCLLLWITSSIWMLDASVENILALNSLAYEIIEGIQGIIVLTVFVLNRYTSRDLYKVMRKKKTTVRNPSRFNKLLEKFKTDNEVSAAATPLQEL